VNVEITSKTEVTTNLVNDNCKVVMVNGEVTSITVRRDGFTGTIEFEKKFAEFEKFVQNVVDVYHSVVLEQIDERRSAEQGTDCLTSQEGL
jgi:hypothetical protein